MKPEVVIGIIKAAKRPVLIVGQRSAEWRVGNEKQIDHLIRIAEATNMPMVATSGTAGELVKRNYKPTLSMSAVDIANRLIDTEWTGADGKGQHDLAIIAGMEYYFEWLLLSGLKHFGGKLKTISLDRFYQPHANWSFPNISQEEWERSLRVIQDGFRRST
jgi:acetyl-CoA decarbonylase/synthase complex subunit epsilon